MAGSFLLATFSIKRNGRVNGEGRNVISNGRNSAAIIKTPINSRLRGDVHGITVHGHGSFRFSFVHYADYLIPSLPSFLPDRRFGAPSADHLPAWGTMEWRVGGEWKIFAPADCNLSICRCNFVQRLSVVMISRLADFYGGKCVQIFDRYIREYITFKLKT